MYTRGELISSHIYSGLNLLVSTDILQQLAVIFASFHKYSGNRHAFPNVAHVFAISISFFSILLLDNLKFLSSLIYTKSSSINSFLPIFLTLMRGIHSSVYSSVCN